MKKYTLKNTTRKHTTMKKFLSLLIVLLVYGQVLKAQQGFGTSNPAPSAVIDMTATNKGALLPRVALISTIVASPVTAPANALTVFNTATAGTAPNNVTPGYYYWNLDAITPANNKWIRLSDSNTPSLDWSLTGNAGTNPATNFLGTTDNQDVVFKVDNQSKAILPKNTGIGLLSGSAANIDGYLASPSALMGGAFTSIIRDHSIYNFSATGSAAGFHGAAAGGTIDAPTFPTSPTALLTFVKGSIFDGTTFKAAARMYFRGDGAASATSLPSSISFYTTAAGTTVERERLMIKNNGFVGIGLPTTPMAPTNMLHVYAAANPVRFQGMQTGTIIGATPDDIVVADASGVLKTVPAASLTTAAVTADNGLTKTLNNIQLGGALLQATTITTDAAKTLAIAGLQTGAATDKIVVADPISGVVKTIDQTSLGIEPWNKMLTSIKATENIDNIYQKGNVAIGTQNGIGTFHIDAAKNNPATGTPTSTNVLDDIIATPGGRIGFGYNPSDVVISGRQFDDKVTFQANDDLDLNYSLATTNNSQAIVHRNIISSGAIGSRAVRPNGTSIAAFEGHTTTSDNNFALGSLSTQQRAGMVLRTGKYNNFGGEIWFGVSGASAGDGGKTLVNTAGVNYRAVMDQKGNWAFGSDPNFDPFWRAPSERLDIILGGMRIGALGYGTLASWRTVEAAERANYISTDVNDKIVVADANGVLKVKDASAIAPNITTNNGITKNATTSEIELGGTLNRATTITTDAAKTLAIAGLQTGAATDKIVVADADGVLKTIAAVNIIKITSAYTALNTDVTILANTTSGGFILTIPAAAPANKGRVLIVRKTDETSNVLTFSSPIKISETTSITTLNINATMRIQSDGADWYKID